MRLGHLPGYEPPGRSNRFRHDDGPWSVVDANGLLTRCCWLAVYSSEIGGISRSPVIDQTSVMRSLLYRKMSIPERIPAPGA